MFHQKIIYHGKRGIFHHGFFYGKKIIFYHDYFYEK